MVCSDSSQGLRLVDCAYKEGEPYDVVVTIELGSEDIARAMCPILQRAAAPPLALHVCSPVTADRTQGHIDVYHSGPAYRWNPILEASGDWVPAVSSQILIYSCNRTAEHHLQALFPDLSAIALYLTTPSMTEALDSLRKHVFEHWACYTPITREMLCRAFPQDAQGKANVSFSWLPEERFETAGRRSVHHLVQYSSPQRHSHFTIYYKPNEDEGRFPGAASLQLVSAYASEISAFIALMEKVGRPLPLGLGGSFRVYVADGTALGLPGNTSFTDVAQSGEPYILLPSFDGALPETLGQLRPIVWREMEHAYAWAERPDLHALGGTWDWFEAHCARYTFATSTRPEDLTVIHGSSSPGRPTPLDSKVASCDSILFFDFLERHAPGIISRVWRSGTSGEHWVETLKRLTTSQGGPFQFYIHAAEVHLERFLKNPWLIPDDYTRSHHHQTLISQQSVGLPGEVDHLCCCYHRVILPELWQTLMLSCETESPFVRPYAKSLLLDGNMADFTFAKDGNCWTRAPIRFRAGMSVIQLCIINEGFLPRTHHLDGEINHDRQRYTIHMRLS